MLNDINSVVISKVLISMIIISIVVAPLAFPISDLGGGY